jgi:chromosome segregation ATPase
MITPSAGVPRPLADSKDPKKTGGANQAAYKAREMDEKARKEREDKQRKLVLQRRALELKKMDLRTQEERQITLRREITALENQSRNFTPTKSKPAVDVKNLERQNAAQIAENEREIKTLEQKILRLEDEDRMLGQNLETKKQEAGKADQASFILKRQADDHQKLIQEKNQEAKVTANRIAALDQEIKMIEDRIKALER